VSSYVVFWSTVIRVIHKKMWHVCMSNKWYRWVHVTRHAMIPTINSFTIPWPIEHWVERCIAVYCQRRYHRRYLFVCLAKTKRLFVHFNWILWRWWSRSTIERTEEKTVNRRLEEDQVVEWLIPILIAVQYIHKSRVVHQGHQPRVENHRCAYPVRSILPFQWIVLPLI
jgi:hypothetical protein